MALKKTYSVEKLLVDSTLLSIYVLPVYVFETIGITVDKYFFLLAILAAYVYSIFKSPRLKITELLIVAFTLGFCFLKRDMTFLHIISLALAYKLLRSPAKVQAIRSYLTHSPMLYVSLAATLFYTLIYFGDGGRYINTSIHDANMSGLALFYLFAIVRERNWKLGTSLMLLGVLCFSKSYMLALVIYFAFEWLYNRGYVVKINYAWLSLASVIILILLSNFFIWLQTHGLLQNYASGFMRFLVFLDYSNYYRFTVNTNLLNIYLHEPLRILTGIASPDFFQLNAQYCRTNSILFRHIRPHNYFFAYMQLYGIWSLPIFYYTYKLFKMVMTDRNLKLSMPLFLYLVFLGMGAANNWLYLSLFALIAAM